MRSLGAGVGTRRILVARILLILPFLALSIRAAHLSVDERGIERGDRQTNRTLALAPERGVIYDRNGSELVLSIDAPSIYANPSAIRDVPGTARQLAKVLGRNRKKVADRISGTRSFTFVSRWVTEEQAERIKDLGLDGIGVVYEPRRVYPHGTMAASLIGFTNIDGFGVRGLEQQMDDWLRGTALRLPAERDARGRLLIDAGKERWSTAGGDVALTLDAAFQADAEAALRRAVAATGARGGVAISLDPHTGDILAMAEAPGFDPNHFRDFDYRATRSQGFLDASEPGSTMKAFLMAAALENGTITPDDRYDCEDGEFKVPGSTIHDSHPHGELSASEILQVSSNIGATKIAFALGPRAHSDALKRFGFGNATGIGFPGESAGVLRPWQKWRPLDHATIAFGQGITTTPIQIAVATAALANGGEWVQPRLVAATRVARGRWQPTRIAARRRVVRPDVAAAVVTMMERVVEPGGTAKRAALRGVRVAGKTGTAQKLDIETGTYADDRFVAWFIGIVPADDPKLVIVAGIDEPRRPLHTGGAAAAPLFAHMAASQLARFGIMTEPGSDAPAPSPAPALQTLTADIATPSPAAAPVSEVVAPVAMRHAIDVAAAPASVTAAAASAAPSRPAVAVAKQPTRKPSTRKKPSRTSPSQVAKQLAPIGDRMLLPDFRGLTQAEVRKITANSELGVKMSGRGRAVAQEPPAGTIVGASQALVFIYFEDASATEPAGEG
jgi:cell division protein FtsI (penicillin-binding protein 3)